MCQDARSSFMAFWLLMTIAVLLWYRNERHDRAISPFLAAVAGIQLIEYGIHRGFLESDVAGKLLYLILWVQVFLFAIGVYFHNRDAPSKFNALLYTGILITVIVFILTTGDRFTAKKGCSGHLEWNHSGNTILGYWSWLYVLGLFIPLLLLLANRQWHDGGLWILLTTLFASCVVVALLYPGLQFPSLWCYSAVAFAFVAWLIGAFY